MSACVFKGCAVILHCCRFAFAVWRISAVVDDIGCHHMQMPPQAHAAAVAQQFALHQLGNASWDIVFGEILPEVRGIHAIAC